MVRVNSKKFFYESAKDSLPNKNLLKNPVLIDIAVEALACFVPQRNISIPEKLKTLLLKRSIEKEAFQEIVSFVAGKDRVDEEGIKLIKFLEQEVIRYVSDWLESIRFGGWKLRSNSEEDLLDLLRGISPKTIPNTCCYSCGKVLERRSSIKANSHFCSIRENYKCFTERKQAEKQEQEEWKFIFSKQKCANCGTPISYSLNATHNSIHNGLYFCSPNKLKSNNKNCYDAYRKNQQRIFQYLIPNK